MPKVTYLIFQKKFLQLVNKYLDILRYINDQEELDGTFYNEELQKVIKEDDVYEIEKILKRRGTGKNSEVFVKWLGYPAKFNSWIPAAQVKDI